ncbi:carbohydrate binding domain-containing protein [Algibacter sp. 2305UL17-15]|uniref:carbohydrate binding domain-containing protein n=1 Tax=Algibacter sp. 2305UL17-15 TaxID=3231268 RepID=UPI003458CE6B
MKKLMSTFKYISILIVALAFVGCEEDDAVLPKVEAGFTYTLNVNTGTVTFINISENANAYEWDLGDGTSSTLINPVKTYANGTYTIVLKAKNVAGAFDTFEDTITIAIPEVVAFPITFDNADVDYGATVFNGTAFQIVDNPALSGSNATASKVGEITNSGAAFEGVAFELGEDLDLSTDKSVKMNFWSDIPISILLKLEITESDAVETTVSHGGTGWEELLFSFSSSKSYPKIVIFVDGPGTTSGKFYIDDLTQVETPPLPCIAETMQSLNAADFNLTFMADPSASVIEDNTTFEYADNPDALTDANKSCKVGKVTNSNQNPWDNMQIDLADKLTFTSGSNFTMKVYAPQAGYKVTLKLEEKGNAGNAKEFPSTEATTKTNEWEELTFPVEATDSNKYDKIVIFFDLQTQNGNTYFFDDLKLNAGTGGGGGGGAFDDGLLTNGDFEDGSTAWIGNAVDVQTEGGNSFNFANVMTAGNPFDVNLSQVVPITPGATYALSFEASSDGNRTMLAGIGLNQDPWSNNVSEVNLTSTPQTFTLELKATDPASSTDFGGANSRVIFDMGAATGVVVIDNVSLFLKTGTGGGGGGGGAEGEFTTNGDFETGDTSGYTIFDANGGVFTVTNEESNGGSFSGKLTSGEGTEVVVKQANIGIGTVTPNTEVTITFDMKGTLMGAGGVIFVEFFSELASEGVSKAEILSGGPLAPTAEWQSFSFTTTTGNDVSGGVTVQLKTACGPVSGCGVEAYFDNVSVKFAN